MPRPIKILFWPSGFLAVSMVTSAVKMLPKLYGQKTYFSKQGDLKEILPASGVQNGL